MRLLLNTPYENNYILNYTVGTHTSFSAIIKNKPTLRLSHEHPQLHKPISHAQVYTTIAGIERDAISGTRWVPPIC
jgi:hypothetical protein